MKMIISNVTLVLVIGKKVQRTKKKGDIESFE